MDHPATETASAPNLILIGFMGTGKSTLGKLLQSRLGYRLVDTDALIVERAGMPITEIFAQEGEAVFRDRESAALKSLLGQQGLVIATGGGIILREGNRMLLRQLGFVVALTAEEAVILERVSRNQKRPLLQTENPRETIARLLAARAPLYAAAAHAVIDTSHKPHASVVEEIVAALPRLPKPTA
jgi:shikimate kinase